MAARNAPLSLGDETTLVAGVGVISIVVYARAVGKDDAGLIVVVRVFARTWLRCPDGREEQVSRNDPSRPGEDGRDTSVGRRTVNETVNMSSLIFPRWVVRFVSTPLNMTKY